MVLRLVVGVIVYISVVVALESHQATNQDELVAQAFAALTLLFTRLPQDENDVQSYS